MLIHRAEKRPNANLASRSNNGAHTSKGLVRKGYSPGSDETGGGRLRQTSPFKKSTCR